MYPDTPTRNENYFQDEQAHLTSPDPVKLDGELNELFAWAASANNWLRNITTADGHLKNFAAGTAESLAGSWEVAATAAQTAFLTDIDWDASFTADNVAVYRNGLRLAASAVAVASGTGAKLQVTIAASTVGDLVKVDAFSSGAGVLTRLASIATGDGASLIGVEDDAGIFSTGADVEGCLYELKFLLDSTITALGSIPGLIRADGTVPMAANLAMGTNKITGLVAGTAPGHAVEYSQFTAVLGSVVNLSTYYLRLDGSTPMTATLDMGATTNYIINVKDPITAQGAATKNYVDTTSVPRTGGILMTGTLGGTTPIADTDFANKAYVDGKIGQTFANVKIKFDTGTEAWQVPLNNPYPVSKVAIHAIGGGAGGGAYSAAGGGGGGYAYKYADVTPGQMLNLITGGGGAIGVDGGTTKVVNLLNSATLAEASGGRHGNTGGGYSGLGGAGITGDFIISGGQASYAKNAGCGGQGGGPYGGPGGSNGAGGEPGRNGTTHGAGGGGAGDSSGAASGAAGAILIFY
jgi:hypothetical protein